MKERTPKRRRSPSSGPPLPKEWVIGRLRENVERALQLKQVLDGQRNPTGEFRYQGAIANRARELLGKEIGMFVDRSEVKTTMGVRLERMTREERLALMHELLEPMKKYLTPAEAAATAVIEGEAIAMEPLAEPRGSG